MRTTRASRRAGSVWLAARAGLTQRRTVFYTQVTAFDSATMRAINADRKDFDAYVRQVRACWWLKASVPFCRQGMWWLGVAWYLVFTDNWTV